MINLTVSTAKKYFVDRIEFINKTERMKVRGVMRQAFTLRTVERRSMRPGGKKGIASDPGEPPRYHKTRHLRDKNYALWDQSTKSAVVGPVLLNGSSKRNRGKTGPETLEFGGSVNVTECLMASGKWVPIYKVPESQRRFLKQRTVTAYVELREYMGPAELKTRAQFAGQFKDSFGKSN